MADGVQELVDGIATHMGEGIFIVIQEDCDGVCQSVVLTPSDLRSMLRE